MKLLAALLISFTLAATAFAQTPTPEAPQSEAQTPPESKTQPQAETEPEAETQAKPAKPLLPVRVSDDGSHFVTGIGNDRFIVWGVNYDHDVQGRLLDEYWEDQWPTVVEDFNEIRSLGANVVRIHLQVGLFLDAPDKPNQAALDRLGKLVKLAEETGLYLDVTGLACYHKKNVPDWFNALDEQQRWDAQATFWKAVARVCKDSPAIFCYDLINEPILPGKDKPADEWLKGELDGKFFVQYLTLDLKGRTREQVAKAWVDKMVSAIRTQDKEHMITVGVIPWVFVFGGGKPLFHGPEVGEKLDFVAIHVYPKTGEIDKAIEALDAYEVGKPLVIEETFPLASGIDGMTEFVRRSSEKVDGWISFYWGVTPEQYDASSEPSIAGAITANWLKTFRDLAPHVKAGYVTVREVE